MKGVKGREKRRLRRQAKRKQLRKEADCGGRSVIELKVTKEEADEIYKS